MVIYVRDSTFHVIIL